MKMKRSQRRKHTLASSKAKALDNGLHISSYTITDEPIRNSKADKLPQLVIDQLDDIFNLLSSNPQQAIEQLLVLKKAYPKAPKLYNFLSVAYMNMGNKEAAWDLIFENYRQNPDYLFAKINYAQLCLDKGEFEKIPLIFDNKFDLKLLYPHRNTFHITEFAGFTGVLCVYYCRIGERDTAQILFKSLKKVAPDSPMVNYAKTFLAPSLFTRLARWLLTKPGKANKTKPQQKNKDSLTFEA
jgi:tetratricopeptide (TPR) repeat protein